jgi:hypothetical protein
MVPPLRMPATSKWLRASRAMRCACAIDCSAASRVAPRPVRGAGQARTKTLGCPDFLTVTDALARTHDALAFVDTRAAPGAAPVPPELTTSVLGALQRSGRFLWAQIDALREVPRRSLDLLPLTSCWRSGQRGIDPDEYRARMAALNEHKASS